MKLCMPPQAGFNKLYLRGGKIWCKIPRGGEEACFDTAH